MCRLLHPKADYIFDQWWQAKWWIRHATAFWNGRNWAKKLIFLAHFESFFVYTPVHPTRYIPRFCQLKYLIKIYICDKFNQYSICGCEIKNFQSLLFWSSINEMAPFWDCLGPLPQILLGLAETSRDENSVWKVLQNLEFWLKWDAVKIYSFGPYWSPIYRWKTKNIGKNQNFCKNYILRNN